MPTLLQSFEILTSKVGTYRREALRADLMHQRALKRLKSFPLWKRIFFFKRFKKMRSFVSHYELKRAFCTMKMLQYQRQLKAVRRRLNDQS